MLFAQRAWVSRGCSSTHETTKNEGLPITILLTCLKNSFSGTQYCKQSARREESRNCTLTRCGPTRKFDRAKSESRRRGTRESNSITLHSGACLSTHAQFFIGCAVGSNSVGVWRSHFGKVWRERAIPFFIGTKGPAGPTMMGCSFDSLQSLAQARHSTL